MIGVVLVKQSKEPPIPYGSCPVQHPYVWCYHSYYFGNTCLQPYHVIGVLISDKAVVDTSDDEAPDSYGHLGAVSDKPGRICP